MDYIKDTDFLPNVMDISNDVYKLLYGVPKLFVETKIYDAITLLCRKYSDAPLRNAKINAWISAVKNVIDTLTSLQRAERKQVLIPYFERRCSVDSLINLYRFAEEVLNEMCKLPTIPPYRKGMDREKVQVFFPFGDFIDVMRDFGKKCAKSGEYGNGVEVAIEKELEERGIIESSTPSPAKSYNEIFFKSKKTPRFTLPKDDEIQEEEVKIDLTAKTGFIYYALEYYFDLVLKKVGGKKDVLATATYRIANGALAPNDERRKKASDNTFYRYADDFRKGEASKSANKKARDLYEKFIAPNKKKDAGTLEVF